MPAQGDWRQQRHQGLGVVQAGFVEVDGYRGAVLVPGGMQCEDAAEGTVVTVGVDELRRSETPSSLLSCTGHSISDIGGKGFVDLIVHEC